MLIDRRSLLAAAAAPAVGGAADPIDAFMLERMQARGIPGAALAMVQGGRLVKARGYGLADVESGREADAATVFPMASASKFLSGLAALKLVEAGKLDLDKPGSAYLSEMVARHPDVLVRQMLSHTSGMAPLSDNAAYSAEYVKRERAPVYVDARKLEFVTAQEMIDGGVGLPPREKPGEIWRYNQYPFFLFGQMVRRITGLPFEEYVQRTLFEPLGMAGAAYGDYRALIAGRRSNNYSRETGVLQNLSLKYTPSFWMAAGCNASAADLGKLLLALRPGGLLTRASLDRIASPVAARKADGSPADYGIASTVIQTDGRRWIGHEGGGCCYIGWWPEEAFGVAVLLNLSGSGEDGIERKIARLALPQTAA